MKRVPWTSSLWDNLYNSQGLGRWKSQLSGSLALSSRTNVDSSLYPSKQRGTSRYSWEVGLSFSDLWQVGSPHLICTLAGVFELLSPIYLGWSFLKPVQWAQDGQHSFFTQGLEQQWGERLSTWETQWENAQKGTHLRLGQVLARDPKGLTWQHGSAGRTSLPPACPYWVRCWFGWSTVEQ